jgi:THAP4-like, heme-binding beta-barrel domain
MIKAYRYRMTPDNGASDQAVGAAVPPPGAPVIDAQAPDSAAPEGPASDGPASDGPASDGPASDGPASDGPASDGPASDGPASDGAASDGAAPDSYAPDGPATDGPATDGPELHPLLAGLRFLIGRWEGAGVVGYPTMESAQFGQELVFRHNGKPYLAYASRTWLLEDDGRIGRPLAEESGFWRPQADGGLEVVLAHASGISEIYYGQITGTKIEMATDAVVRTATAQDVTAGRRLYGLIGTDLGYAYDLAASGHPLQAHTSAQLKRVSFAG